ncbi:MAG: hypothetical protein AAGB00_07110 [Planctomycetota bacterium]
MKMFVFANAWRLVARAGFLALIGLTVGCSEQTAQVGGKVLLDGEALSIRDSQRGMVVFRPVAGGATCTGLIDKLGEYQVATGSRSSLVPGDYLVSVRVIELVEATSSGEAPAGKPITPAVYADPLTSGISFLVKSGRNQCDISLDSAAGPAVAPGVMPAEGEVDAESAGDARAAGADSAGEGEGLEPGAVADGGIGEDIPGADTAPPTSEESIDES